ncbi:alpha/beta fold hydrolase [Halosegnis marinus]|uniref:Alpha/beta fold hydrolase n=1 Tax=Halosegnis marinus TaxID=3034023 RepID=A0ABD5ZQ59_9EURY|nr:alpha/beta hydrolase [Halosegnis sp. DT85]
MNTAEEWAEAQGFETGVAETSEVSLHYVAAGPETAPMVVLLHGFPEFWYTWRKQLAPLAEEFRVVAPDLRGYNRSDRPRGVEAYGLSRLRNDVYELIQSFGRGSAHLVGHDWGGSLALSFARHHPAHVDRLVVANTLDPERLGAQIRGTQLLRSWYTGLFQLPRVPEAALSADDFRALRALFDATATEDAYTDADLDRYRVAWEREGALRAGVNYYRALGRSTLRDALSLRGPERIYVPTRVLWGQDDEALRPAVADALCDGIDDPDLKRYDDATHWLHAERPERFVEDVRAFLA